MWKTTVARLSCTDTNLTVADEDLAGCSYNNNNMQTFPPKTLDNKYSSSGYSENTPFGSRGGGFMLYSISIPRKSNTSIQIFNNCFYDLLSIILTTYPGNNATLKKLFKILAKGSLYTPDS